MTRQEQGFTLIELMVATTVALLSIAALARSAASILGGRRLNETERAATMIAERQLEELLAEPEVDLDEQDRVDLVATRLGEFERQTIVEPGQSDNLWHLEVTVTPSRGGGPVRLHTLQRRPWELP